MRLRVRSLALLSGLRIQCCCELWCKLQMRIGSALLWLWCRPAATAPIRPLAREPPYATGAAVKRQKEKEKRKGSPIERLWALECVSYLQISRPCDLILSPQSWS